jgi:hypothetical protein
MIIVNQQHNVPAYFRAGTVDDRNAEQLGDIQLSFTSSNYCYLTIEEATKLRDVLTECIDLAITAKNERYLKAIALVASMEGGNA